jgi:5-methylcytosine-specific restriction endonuclease McrA
LKVLRKIATVVLLGVLLSSTAAQAKNYRAVALKYVVKKCWGWVKDPYSGKHYRTKNMDVDHIWPKKYGGPDAPWNLVFSGKSENRSKGAKIDHRVIQGYYHKAKLLFQ